jgi:hypothetical protein
VAGTARESTVINAGRAVLKRRGAFFFKTQAGGYGGHAGLPDFVCCYRGLFVGLEAKAPGGKHPVSALQARCGEHIQRAGGVWAVVRSKEEIEAVLDSIDERLVA